MKNLAESTPLPDDHRKTLLLNGNQRLVWAQGYIDCPANELFERCAALDATADLGAHIASKFQFDGTYAMAIEDKETGEIHLQVDALGMGVIYFTEFKDGLRWAFRLTDLLDSMQATELATRGLDEFMLYRLNSDSHTMLKNIRRVMPGQRVVLNIDASPEIYHHNLLTFEPIAQGKKLDAIVKETDTAISEYFRRLRLKYNRVAVFLSGGVDSSLLLAKANEHNFQRLIAITSRFVGYENLELEQATNVARHLKIEHIIVDISDTDIESAIPHITNRLEAPITYFNVIAREHMFRALKDTVDAVIIGQGADGMFSEEYGGAANGLSFHRKQRFVQYIPDPVRKTIGGVLGKSKANILKRLGDVLRFDTPDYLRAQGVLFPAGRENGKVSAEDLIPALRNIREHRDEYFYKYFEPHQFAKPITPASILKFSQHRSLYTRSRHQCFCYDRLASAYSITPVYPFFCDAVKDIGLSLPTEFRSDYRGTKPALKILLSRFIPEELVYSKKMGFETPLEDWLIRNESFWRNLLNESQTVNRELFNQRATERLDPAKDSLLIMAAISLEHFLRQFIDRMER